VWGLTMDNKQLIGGVGVVSAIVSFITYSGPGPQYASSPATSAGASAPVPAPAPRTLPRMRTDVHACTMDAEHDASGGLASGSCTVLRAGEEIEVQFWFSENPNARAGDRDLEPCVRAASWPPEAGVRDPRESRDCVAISRDDYEEVRR
jgi:hypothetical protein